MLKVLILFCFANFIIAECSTTKDTQFKNRKLLSPLYKDHPTLLTAAWWRVKKYANRKLIEFNKPAPPTNKHAKKPTHADTIHKKPTKKPTHKHVHKKPTKKLTSKHVHKKPTKKPTKKLTNKPPTHKKPTKKPPTAKPAKSPPTSSTERKKPTSKPNPSSNPGSGSGKGPGSGSSKGPGSGSGKGPGSGTNPPTESPSDGYDYGLATYLESVKV